MKKYLLIIIALSLIGCVKKGVITISTIPDGAEVYLNGAVVGKSPITFEQELKDVKQLKIILDGYYPIEESINWGWIHYEIANGNGTERVKGEYQGKRKTIWRVNTRRTLLSNCQEKKRAEL